MFDRREFLGGAVLGAASLAPAAAIAGAQIPSTPIANTAQRLNAFGPEADRLAQRAGLWDVVETVWDRPEGESVTTSGLVAERAMFGSMLQEILRPPADIGRRAVARADMLAYNRMEGRWGYVSFDTRAPVGLMPAWSNVYLAGDPANGGGMDYAGMNEGYRQFFGTSENPNLAARATVQVVALAEPAFLVEIEATAVRMPTKR